MNNPFKDKEYNSEIDKKLIDEALNGSKISLEKLIKRHQDYIYNIAMRMVLSPFDAEDITQEVLIKIITNLSQFEGRSDFRTWIYKITFNHFLKMKKYWLEDTIKSFDQYGDELDNIEDVDMNNEEKIANKELIEEAKYSCMLGMLLCLDRDQRLVYILGEIFEADHNIGSEILNISKDNYRKKLERARKDLYQFMNNKCGLINKNNPCRCSRKTTGFIKAGWVDKNKMKFNTNYLNNVSKEIGSKNSTLDDIIEHDYSNIFGTTPFQIKDHSFKLFKELIEDPKLKWTFNFN